MDIVLRGNKDGIEAAREIYNRFDIPVIFLTAYSDTEILRRAWKAGSYAYLIKPIREKELLSNIEIALDRHDREKELKHREQWFSAVMNNLSEPMICVDRDRQVCFFNTSAQMTTGWKREEVLGRRLEQLIANFSPWQERTLQAVLDSGSFQNWSQVEVRGKQPADRTFAEAHLSPVRNEHGTIVGCTLILFEEPLKDPEGAECEAGPVNQETIRKNYEILCPWCKKINNSSSGEWESLESFFQNNPRYSLYHCTCPQCAKWLFEGMEKSIESEKIRFPEGENLH